MKVMNVTTQILCYMKSSTIQLLHNTKIKDVALHYSKSPSQLLLRWAVQQGIGLWCIIPYMEPSNNTYITLFRRSKQSYWGVFTVVVAILSALHPVM